MSFIPITVSQIALKTYNTFTPLSQTSKTSGPVTPLTSTPNLFYLRRDSSNPRTTINVFSTEGNMPYVFERLNRLSTRWRLSRADTREPIAIISIALGDYSVQFLAKPGLKKRELTSDRALVPGGYKFYLNDGGLYSWDSATRYLERIRNPGSGSEEVRQRLAAVSLLRRFSFDWELQVDPRLDPEVVLATVLVPLLTEWPTTKLDRAGGVRTIVPAKPEQSDADKYVDGVDPKLMVYSDVDKATQPRNFFNPPAFIEDPWIEG